MPEILKDAACCIGVSYLIYHFYSLAVSTAKIFTDRDESESADILRK